MVSETLEKALMAIREDAPPALYPVLDAFMDESEDAPEEAWLNVLTQTLDES